MSKTKNRVLSLFMKAFKLFAYTLLALFVLVNLFILLSGRTYLYKGIMSTYLSGKTGPTIYDLNKFAYRTLEKGKSVDLWNKSSDYNSQKEPENFEKYNQETESKAFLVFKGDDIVFEKYWDNHTDKTVSNSFSAAKTVVALLVGIAIEEGKIKSLDDPIGNYLPEFKEGDKSIITVRNLLNMSSGLDWTESGKNPLSNNAESYYGTDLYGLVTRQNLIRKPGKDFIYQSGNSQLLGFIIQKATGMSVSDYCSEKIWSKIGMEANAFWSLDKEGGDEKAFCCLYATARDFGRIGKLIMRRGKFGSEQIIPEWYIREMEILPAKMGSEEGVANHQYGLHIWLYEGYKSPVQYCRGIKGQYMISIPDEDLVIVRLGSIRLKDFEVPKDKKMIESELPFIGHPTDLPDYINFAEKIIEQTKSK